MNRLSESELARFIGDIEPRIHKSTSGYICRCPLPDHHDRTGSMHVYAGRSGAGRFHCFGCGADGDSLDWQAYLEGKLTPDDLRRRGRKALPDGASFKQDPEAQRAREIEALKERAIAEAFNRYPDLPPEAQWFIEPLSLALRRRLSGENR